MTPEELQKLEQKLLEERTVVERELLHVSHKGPVTQNDYQIAMVTSDFSDSLDAKAHEVTEYERDKAVEQKLEVRLREINTTLQKIKLNTYGLCARCQTPIPARRLEAMPTATTCITCAQKSSTFF